MFRVSHAFLSVYCSLVVTCPKGLTSWPSCMLCFIVFLLLPHVASWGQARYLIVSIPDLCLVTKLTVHHSIRSILCFGKKCPVSYE